MSFFKEKPSHLQVIDAKNGIFKTSAGSFINAQHCFKAADSGLITLNDATNSITLNEGTRMFVNKNMVFFTNKPDSTGFTPW